MSEELAVVENGLSYLKPSGDAIELIYRHKNSQHPFSQELIDQTLHFSSYMSMYLKHLLLKASLYI